MKYPNIDAERARKNLSLEDFAKELGVSRNTVYNWMRSGNIPQGALLKMADFFDKPIDYLLGRSA